MSDCILYGQAYTFSLPFRDLAGNFLDDPVFAVGDVQVSLDGAPFVNTTNLPVVTASSPFARMTLTAAEVTATTVDLLFRDQTDPSDWQEIAVTLNTTSVDCSDGVTQYTEILRDTSMNPIPEARVFATTNADGSNAVDSDVTDDFGSFTFTLQTGGNYFLVAKKTGFDFGDPVAFTVP